MNDEQKADKTTPLTSVASSNNDSDDGASSADNVDNYLQALENKELTKQRRPLSPEEQLFTEEELARLINPDKLAVLMKSGDNLLGYLTGEIDRFEE